ncbi:SDR family oxidoreductase [Burkholderia metallica]|uniref:SDR family oxidoreductase n=1 Tax=Burkholderia metallica TaxID=488729 RepID=UPI0015775E3A|nr:SDR family oxidoreductase [Burkholderia metallica]NTZ04963.1 SDR family oxidoreductase [Burkholderia metallica]
MIVVTGATGQLGRLVVNQLLSRGVPAAGIVAAVRTPSKAADLAALGMVVREADYSRPETLDAAFAGAERVLLISSSELGQRGAQHKAVIEAAKKVGVQQLAYTSALHADRSPMSLAVEHRETEAIIVASGLPYVLLRNGWYVENYLASLPAALAHGAFIGSAGEGRISWAPRADFADAAAAVLTQPVGGNRVYELAGDIAYTRADMAAEVNRQTGKSLQYVNMPGADYATALQNAGLPAAIAELIAESDDHAARDALFDDGRQLSALIGRPTTSLSESVAAALAEAQG